MGKYMGIFSRVHGTSVIFYNVYVLSHIQYIIILL